MRVAGCNRCHNWDDAKAVCIVETGCEHLPLVPALEVPECPMQDRCQHQIQAGLELCVVRARGMICESALDYDGHSQPSTHPLSFHAMTIASPEEWARREIESKS